MRPLSVADISRRKAELKTLYSVLDAEESILQVTYVDIFILHLNFFLPECSAEAFPSGIVAKKGFQLNC